MHWVERELERRWLRTHESTTPSDLPWEVAVEVSDVPWEDE
jgi:hypothetical protein